MSTTHYNSLFTCLNTLLDSTKRRISKIIFVCLISLPIPCNSQTHSKCSINVSCMDERIDWTLSHLFGDHAYLFNSLFSSFCLCAEVAKSNTCGFTVKCIPQGLGSSRCWSFHRLKKIFVSLLYYFVVLCLRPRFWYNSMSLTTFLIQSKVMSMVPGWSVFQNCYFLITF